MESSTMKLVYTNKQNELNAYFIAPCKNTGIVKAIVKRIIILSKSDKVGIATRLQGR